MKAAWVGKLKIGILTIDVKLYKAWKPSLKFRLLCKEHKKPIHYKKVCEEGEELSKEGVVKGIKMDGHYLVVDRALLEVLREEKKELRVERIVPGKPSPLYVKESFIVAPDQSEEQLAALIEALGEERHLEGHISYRRRLERCALFVEEGMLVLAMLHYKAELQRIEFAKETSEEAVRFMADVLAHLPMGKGDEEEDPLYVKIKKYIEAKKKG